jgi:hypothetical protein
MIALKIRSDLGAEHTLALVTVINLGLLYVNQGKTGGGRGDIPMGVARGTRVQLERIIRERDASGFMSLPAPTQGCQLLTMHWVIR